MIDKKQAGMGDIPLLEGGVQTVIHRINHELSQGKEPWVFGSASLDLGELELAGFPGDAVRIGLNRAVATIPRLDYCFAVDYNALRYFAPRNVQQGLVFMFPWAPQVLRPGSRIGKTLHRYEGKYTLPQGFRGTVEARGVRVAYFDYLPLANPGGGTFYASWSAHPDGFYSFKDRKNRWTIINGPARLTPARKEEAAGKIARLLYRESNRRAPSYLCGIMAGRALIPLIYLLVRTRAAAIHMAGFSCDNPDVHMTNLAAGRLASLYGKHLIFHLPGNPSPLRVTGKGFEPYRAPSSTAAGPSGGRRKKPSITVLLPFFLQEKDGRQSRSLRSQNLGRTLESIERFKDHPSFDIDILLLEASESGQSQFHGSKNHLVFKKAGTIKFPKQFLFLVGLKLLKRWGKGDEIAIMHDIDIPMTDPDFFTRVYVALKEKNIIHNVIKAAFLPPGLSKTIMEQIDERGDFDRAAVSKKLFRSMKMGKMSNEVSRYLFCSSRRLIEIEDRLVKAAGKGNRSRLTPEQKSRCFFQLPLVDRVALRYMWNLQWAYKAQHRVNYFFPGFSWSGRVDHLMETILISSLYTGWGFEDSAFMETARKLWGDTGVPGATRRRDKVGGVGCIVGPSGILLHRNQCVCDALHQFHPTLHGIPSRAPGMGLGDYHREVFGFELKKVIQLAFIESEGTGAEDIRRMNRRLEEAVLKELVDQTIKEFRIPPLDMIEDFSHVFQFAGPGEAGALEVEKLLDYYRYWRRIGEVWRIYDLPGRDGGVAGALFENNFLFRMWARAKQITRGDLTLHLEPKLPEPAWVPAQEPSEADAEAPVG